MTSAPARAAGVVVRRLRWWDVEALLPVERDLFGADCWSEALFWSELAETDTRWYVVAEQDGQVVGYAGLCAYPDRAYVQTLAVRRDLWGQGLGGRLLELLLAEARRRGRSTVALEVRADNERAQRLYLRYGFAPESRRRGYYQPSGADALVMVRPAGVGPP